MLYREIIAVCSQIHTKYINTPCGQNGELLNVKLAVQKMMGFEAVNVRCTESYILVSLYGLSPCLRFWKINKRWQQELGLSAGGGSVQQFSGAGVRDCSSTTILLCVGVHEEADGGSGYLAHAVRRWSAHSTLLPLLNKHGVSSPHQRRLSATINLLIRIVSTRA